MLLSSPPTSSYPAASRSTFAPCSHKQAPLPFFPWRRRSFGRRIVILVKTRAQHPMGGEESHHHHHQQHQQQKQQQDGSRGEGKLSSPSPSPAAGLEPNPSPDERSSNVRLDVSPSVLRALDGEQSSASSLIEKNLRKRRAARRSNQIESEPAGAPPEVSVDVDSCSGPSNDSPSVAETIKHVYWEEIPENLLLPPILTLDFHAKWYRMCFLLYILRNTDLSLSSLLWFGLPSGFLSSQPSWPSALLVQWAKWRRAIATDLSNVVGNSQNHMEAGELYWQFWYEHNDAEQTAAAYERRWPLTLSLALTLEVQMLEAVQSGGHGTDTPRLEKHFSESASALAGALRELLRDVLDPVGLWEHLLKGTSFSSDGRVFIYEEGAIFPGTLAGEPGLIIEEVQKRLDERYPGKVALLLKSETQQQVNVVIAPWYWLLSVNLDQLSWLKYLLLAGSVFGTTQFAAAYAGLGSGIAWEEYILPLGWSAVLASGFLATGATAKKYNVSRIQRSPFVFSVPFLGAVGRCTPFSGRLPSRSCLLDIILNGSLASLVVSLSLLAVGFTFWGPAQFFSATTVDFHGYLLVPSDMFSYSSVFTAMLNTLSVAAVNGDGGNVDMAVSPFAIAGLIGLSFTAFSLFPTAESDGTLVLRAVSGNFKVANRISLALTALMMVALFSKSPAVGFWWYAYSNVMVPDSLVKEQDSEPTLLKRVAGLALVATAIICFIPFPQ